MLLATNVLLACSLPLSLSLCLALCSRLASSAAQVKWRNASKTLEPLRQLRRVANTKLWLSSELNFPTCGRLCFPTRLRRSEKRRYSFSFRAPRAVKIVAVPLRMRSSQLAAYQENQQSWQLKIKVKSLRDANREQGLLCLEIRRKESDPAAAASQATTTTTIIIIATCVATKVKVRAFVAPAAAAVVVVVVVVLLQEQAAPCRANDTDTRTRIIGPAGGSACRCSASPSSLRSAAAAAELPLPWAIPVHSRSTTCSYWMRSPGAVAPVTMARTASWRCYPEVLLPLPDLYPYLPLYVCACS